MRAPSPGGRDTRIYQKVGDTTTAVSLAYDALARVSSATDAKRATTESYLHDDEGLRIKITDSATGLVKYNVFGESRQLLAQYEKPSGGSLTWKRDIVYVGTKEIAEVDATGTEITFVDHLGSPRFAWKGGANAVVKQKFLPFGESLADPATAKNFGKGFTGHENSDADGLIYMQARLYAPWYGKFLSPDPARDQHYEMTQSWNIYSYVMNSPVMKIDPTGEVGVDFQRAWNAIKAAWNTPKLTGTERHIALTGHIPKANWRQTDKTTELGLAMSAAIAAPMLAPSAPTVAKVAGPATATLGPKAPELIESGRQAVEQLTQQSPQVNQALQQGAQAALSIKPSDMVTPWGNGPQHFSQLADLIGWPKGGGSEAQQMAKAQELMKTIDVSRVQEAGFTKQMATQWSAFYQEAAKNSNNHNAAPRAELMKYLSEKLK